MRKRPRQVDGVKLELPGLVHGTSVTYLPLLHGFVCGRQVIRLVVVLRIVPALEYAFVDLRSCRDLADLFAAKNPETRKRLVQLVMWVAYAIRKPILFYPHPARYRLAEHPMQGDVRQPAFAVPAAYVRMDAREPDLLKGLIRPYPALVPEKRRKIVSLLVYGQGVEAVDNLGVEPRVMKTLARVQCQRRYGVPHADEVDRTGTAERLAEAARKVGVFGGVVNLRGVFDKVPGVRAEQSAFVKHPGQRTHGERATAEPEQIHAISAFVTAHQVAIGVLDVFLEPVAGRLVGQGCQFSTLFVVFPAARAYARVVVRDLGRVFYGQIVGFHNVRVVASVFVAGSVAANDDVLHTILLD